MQRESFNAVVNNYNEMFRTYGTQDFTASRFYKYFVPLALIRSNWPKRLIGSCSRGAKYL
jgi:hypothetical protein